MSEKAESQLETFTTDELWEELRTRFKSAVLVTERDHKTNENESMTGLWYGGGKIMAVGLLKYGEGRLLKSLLDETEASD